MFEIRLTGPLKEAAEFAHALRQQFPNALITWRMDDDDTYIPLTVQPENQEADEEQHQ